MRLVLIDWVDSFGCSAHWEKIEQSMKAKPLTCRSVGWLLYDGDDCKVIVPHLTEEYHATASFQGCGDMTIPASSIVRIVDLKPRSKKKRPK